jgi:hypothetical protein
MIGGTYNKLVFPVKSVATVNRIGEPLTWTTSYIYYDGMVHRVGQRTAFSQLTKGLDATNIFKVRIDEDINVNLNDVFYIGGQNGAWKVNSEVDKHFQLGTDLVEYTEFTATKTSGLPTKETIDGY